MIYQINNIFTSTIITKLSTKGELALVPEMNPWGQSKKVNKNKMA